VVVLLTAVLATAEPPIPAVVVVGAPPVPSLPPAPPPPLPAVALAASSAEDGELAGVVPDVTVVVPDAAVFAAPLELTTDAVDAGAPSSPPPVEDPQAPMVVAPITRVAAKAWRASVDFKRMLRGSGSWPVELRPRIPSGRLTRPHDV
jgi:hypothetical protein